MYQLTASKSVDGITSTTIMIFGSFQAANAANWDFQDKGYTVKLIKKG